MMEPSQEVLDAVQRIRVQRLLFMASAAMAGLTNDPAWIIGGMVGVVVWAILTVDDEDIRAATDWEDEEEKREMERIFNEDWR